MGRGSAAYSNGTHITIGNNRSTTDDYSPPSINKDGSVNGIVELTTCTFGDMYWRIMDDDGKALAIERANIWERRHGYPNATFVGTGDQLGSLANAYKDEELF